MTFRDEVLFFREFLMASGILICVRFKLVRMHLQSSDYPHFDFSIESENISGNHR